MERGESMKKIITGLLLGAFLLGPAGASLAVDYIVSVNVPQATGISVTASNVLTNGNVFRPVNGSELSFNTLTLDPVNKIFQPDHYFALDVGTTGGAGTPASITVTYSEIAKPVGQVKGLGYKVAATFAKEEGATETILVKKKLQDVSGEQITASQITGGYLRILLGVVSGDPATSPAGSEPIKTTDQPGDYSGKVTITATLT